MTTPTNLTRRHLLRLGTLAATGSLMTRFQPAMAGPFTGADFEKLVPADKKLTAAWIRSLFDRGEPDWSSGTDLQHIGMPVGGICCGQVYLSGDGRLWHWDIFNHDVAPKNRTEGPHYAKPMPVTSAVDIGFHIRANGETRTLDHTGFPQVRFRGAYPIGFVDFRDEAFPVKVSLEAFSPFVPLDVDASSLPLTVMRYTVRNTSNKNVEVSLAGHLANPILIRSGIDGGEEFLNRIEKRTDATCLHCTVEQVKSEAGQEVRPDMGDMTLAILEDGAGVFTSPRSADFSPPELPENAESTHRSTTERPKGTVGKSLTLAPGEETTVSFAVAWRFPNHSPTDIRRRNEKAGTGHHYAERFSTSLAVVDHHAAQHAEAHARTRLWHDTWYDSTLPYWLLDRTFLNISTLATTTCVRFANGRFWGWEGVACCGGTCNHVWHYAQSVGRVFPELERLTREHVDYGIAFKPDGMILYRADYTSHGAHEAIDGQAGTILRVYREHLMSPDDAFLRRIWPKVKSSIEFLIRQDGDGNGVLEGRQYNTLDAAWHGPVSWITSLYLASLRAGAAMAREMGDETFAGECDGLVERGGKWVADNLFDGEYFYQKRDPKHPDAFGSGIGCHIDQVFGQGWAHQLGLGRILPADKTRSALKALWHYNFSPDVGHYRNQYKTGRWYAMPGEAGLIMCTFPKGGEKEARGGKPGHGFAGYFNECMNGFEYQAAWHMIAEGLVEEGLAVTRAIHDRYAPSRRNPFNEIECGDHYARSMASHGVFVSLCGFECHGPKKHLGFAPKITPENFKAPFIAVEGWGTFTQQIENGTLTAELVIRHGKLPLATLALAHDGGDNVSVKHGDTTLPATIQRTGNRIVIALATPLELTADGKLAIIVI